MESKVASADSVEGPAPVDHALASFLRQNMDELVVESTTRFRREYPHSQSVSLSLEDAAFWTKSQVVDLIEQLDTGAIDATWYNRNKGDMVAVYDAMFRPLALTVDLLLFYGRVIAPMLWRHYGDDPRTARALCDALERFIQRMVVANTESFLGQIGAYGALTGSWDFYPYAMAGETPLSDAAQLHRPKPAPVGAGVSAVGEIEEEVGALTDREVQVARLVVGGKTNKEIAVELGLHQGTVKNHLSSIFAKLGVSSRTELAVRLAAREG